jgi:hypothetical protein
VALDRLVDLAQLFVRTVDQKDPLELAGRITSLALSDTPGKKPVSGVVLEFATRMRQSRGREVALND